jgi:phage terminase small subunit
MAKKEKKTSLDSEVSEKTTERKLTPEQELFCLEYLKDFNATRAAKAAGYSEKTAAVIGWENLQKPYIQSRIRDRMNEAFGDAKDDIRRIIDELKMIAFGDIADLFDWGKREIVDSEGDFVEEVEDLNFKTKEQLGEKTRLITEIEQVKTRFGNRIKIKQADKMRAIELLGKYYKLFTDKIEHTNPDGNLKPQVFVYLPKNSRESDE